MPRKKDNLTVQLAQFKVTCQADGADKGDELPRSQVQFLSMTLLHGQICKNQLGVIRQKAIICDKWVVRSPCLWCHTLCLLFLIALSIIVILFGILIQLVLNKLDCVLASCFSIQNGKREIKRLWYSEILDHSVLVFGCCAFAYDILQLSFYSQTKVFLLNILNWSLLLYCLELRDVDNIALYLVFSCPISFHFEFVKRAMENENALLCLEQFVNIFNQTVWRLITGKWNLIRSIENFTSRAFNLKLFDTLLLFNYNCSKTASLYREVAHCQLAWRMPEWELSDKVGIEWLISVRACYSGINLLLLLRLETQFETSLTLEVSFNFA